MKPPFSKSVGWTLVQAARLHRTRIGRGLAELDLFAGQEQVLQALDAAGCMTIGDLAQALAVRPPTASKMVSRLAARSLVRRRTEPGDGRIVHVELTLAGRTMLAQVERVCDRVEAKATAGLEPAERKQLARFLNQAARNLARAVSDEQDEGE